MTQTHCPSLGCSGRMEAFIPGTPEQAFCGTWTRCTRCHSSILTPSAELQAQLHEQRKALAVDAANDVHIRAGFQEWLSNEAYLSSNGYRLKTDRRRLAKWSKTVTKHYPDNADFHEAAHLWAEWRKEQVHA